MDVSRAVSGHARPQTLTLLCDFLPEVRDEAISEQLQQSSGEAGRRSLVHALGEFVPSRLAAALLEVAQIPPLCSRPAGGPAESEGFFTRCGEKSRDPVT
jgi:predicted flavoprotein YhiN